MHFPRLKSVVLALALLGLVAPTGAALTSGSTEEPFDGNEVALAPSGGPNGQYASVGANGKLSVDLSTTGVNNNGETVVERVFVIQNRGDEQVRTWVTHDANKSVVLYESISGGVRDRSTIDKRAIQSASNKETLQPGEHINVSIYVDTRSDNTTVGNTLLNNITLHVRQLDAEQSGGTGQSDDEVIASGNATGIEAQFDVPNTVVNETGTDAEPTEDEEFTIEELDPEGIPEEVPPGSEPQPRAVITDVDTTLTGTDGEAIDLQGADKVITTGELVTLDGHRSTVNRTSGVEIDRRIVRAADITPPAGRENQPGTVRMEVSRDRLNSAPENAQMGHLTENGWELLETEIVSQNADTVVYEARTPGFSPFAVFDGPDVEYEWTLPDGSTVQGPEVQSTFDEPGFYNVTLTITDAFGNSDTAEYRILVNDRPEIAIEHGEPVVPGEPTTLRANVTDEIGNATVTWELPNGSEAEGRTVNYTFTNGSFDVSATAEDEFGETATAETTITTEDDSQLAVSAGGFPLLTLLLSTGILVLVGAVALWLWRLGPPTVPGWITIPTMRKHLQITDFEDPSWDPQRGQFEIGQLRVEDIEDDLQTVEIGIRTSEETEVARKTIYLDGVDVYEASSLRIPGVPTESVDPTRKYNAYIRVVDAEGNEETAVTALRFTRTFDTQPGFRRGVAAD